MKNQKFIIGLLAIGVAISCNKNDRTIESEQHLNNMQLINQNTALFTDNNMAWADLVIGYDQVDAGRRHAKLHLSQGLAEVLKDVNIASWIINKAKQSTNNVFYIEDLFVAFPNTKAIFQSVQDPLNVLTGLTFEQIQQRMQYDNYNIKASIYLHDADSCAINLPALASPGFDLDLPESEQLGDIVLGWQYSNNIKKRINISEAAIKTSRNPLLIIEGIATNLTEIYGTDASITLDRPGGPHSSTVSPEVYNHRINIKTMRISRRYDNSANSEIHLAGKCEVNTLYYGGASTSIEVGGFIRANCVSPHLSSNDVQLVELHKSYINAGTEMSINKFFCWMYDQYSWGGTPATINDGGDFDHYFESGTGGAAIHRPRKTIYYNLYERDWYASNKTLSPYTIRGSVIDLKGKMENYNEWYIFNPASFTGNWSDNYRFYIRPEHSGVSYSEYRSTSGVSEDKARIQIGRAPGVGCN